MESGGSLRGGGIPYIRIAVCLDQTNGEFKGQAPSPDYFIFHFRFFIFMHFARGKWPNIDCCNPRLGYPEPRPLTAHDLKRSVICLDIRSRNINYAWTKAPTSAALDGRYPLMVINLHKSHWGSLPRDLLLITWGMYWWLGVWWWWKIKCGLPQGGYSHIRNFSHLTISELNSVKTLSLMTNSLVVLIPTNRRQINYLTFLEPPPPPPCKL